jgi:SAM-dependent methyltransferase
MSGPRPSLESGLDFFVDLTLGYRRAKVVFVAHELSIFRTLGHGSSTDTEVARALETDARATRILLRALVGIGLLEYERGTYRNSSYARTYLLPDSDRYVGNNVAFQEMIWPAWSDLAQVVRTGAPRYKLLDLLTRQDQRFTTEYIHGMHNIARRPAEEVARILAEMPLLRFLDVGGGPGTFSMALLDRIPGSTGTLFDLPTTLAVARQIAASHAGRLAFREGDYLRDDFGYDFDLVLMSHITHDESPMTNVDLFKRAHAALRSGGRVAVHDFVVSSDGCHPPFSALFAVNMLVYTEGGQTYSVEEYSEMLRSAGFDSIVARPVLEGQVANATHLIVATRP